jgi:AraC-like DNA-binding protein
MVTIREIHSYLNDLTPQDRLFKKYYLETGHLLPIDKIEDFLNKNALSGVPPSPLSFLNPAYHGSAEAMGQPHQYAGNVPPGQNYSLKTNKHFDPQEGISIRKHGNYFPSFCHSHSFMEVCHVLKGQCRHQFYPRFQQKEQSDSITMSEGDLLIIPPSLYHTISSLTDSVIINIMVKRTAIEKTITQFLADDVPLFGYFTKIMYDNRIDSYLLFRIGKNGFLGNLLDQLLLEYCNRPPLYTQIMSQILGLYFSVIQRNHGNEIKVSEVAPVGNDYIPKFLLYLQSNFTSFSMNNMENHFHLSASYISRIFKANTGKTIMDTLTGIRLENAKNLLQSTSLLIDDIAAHMGYDDTTYFIRIFKKKFSMTPLQYRKNTFKMPLSDTEFISPRQH